MTPDASSEPSTSADAMAGSSTKASSTDRNLLSSSPVASAAGSNQQQLPVSSMKATVPESTAGPSRQLLTKGRQHLPGNPGAIVAAPTEAEPFAGGNLATAPGVQQQGTSNFDCLPRASNTSRQPAPLPVYKQQAQQQQQQQTVVAQESTSKLVSDVHPTRGDADKSRQQDVQVCCGMCCCGLSHG
jgi:hypothetical protein